MTERLQIGDQRDRLAARFDLVERNARKSTGAYDLLGSPIYTDGDVLLETVYRFKGQSAPCVVLTEIDFEALDDLALRKLFVGATRATMMLMLFLSERAATLLLGRLDGSA